MSTESPLLLGRAQCEVADWRIIIPLGDHPPCLHTHFTTKLLQPFCTTRSCHAQLERVVRINVECLTQTGPIRGFPQEFIRRGHSLHMAGQVTQELQVAVFPARGPRGREGWNSQSNQGHLSPIWHQHPTKTRSIPVPRFYKTFVSLPYNNKLSFKKLSCLEFISII